MSSVLLVSAAVIPSLLILWFVHARDVFPEPPRVVWRTFGLGVLSVVPAVAIESFLTHRAPVRGVLSGAAFDAFVVAALCEEGLKLAVLLFYSFRQSDFDEPMDGIVYGTAASLGFATLENVMYVADGGLGVAVIRGLLSVPGHATYGAVMGAFVGRARMDSGHRWRLIATGFAAAVLLHGFYDLPLLGAKVTGGSAAAGAAAPSPASGFLWLTTVASVIVGWTWSLRLVAARRREQLALQAQSAPVPAPHESSAHVEAVHETPKAPRGGAAMAWLGVLGGAVVASGGGLIVAACLAAIAFGSVEAGDRSNVGLGMAIIGGLPATLGLWVFGVSVRRLNRLRVPAPRA